MGSVINGTPGNDTLISTGIGDTLVGGSADDTYFVNDAADVVLETTSDSPTIFVTNTVVNLFAADAAQQGSNVVFTSKENNLVVGVNDSQVHVYSKDTVTGIITLVSSNAAGAANNDFVADPAVSADGSKVAFTSYANNLLTGDVNLQSDIYVKDLTTGAVTLVSTTSTGSQGNNHSLLSSISADGSAVAFVTLATNLTTGDSNNARDIFVKDLSTGTLTLASSDSSGVIGNGTSIAATLSADGSKVLFTSFASNLVAGDTNGVEDVFMKDLKTGVTTLISADVNGVEGDHGSTGGVFSPDGSKIAFMSAAHNLVPGGVAPGFQHLYLKDIATGAVTLLSTADDGTVADGSTLSFAFSPDGKKVAFTTWADNLGLVDGNAVIDLYIKDLTTGDVTRVSSETYNVANLASELQMSFTQDGDILFVSNLAGTSITNQLLIQDLNSQGGRDTINASVSYTLSANVENLTLTGTAAINGTGNALDNVITGNAGNNTLNGGSGTDTLIGGAGNDLYLVNSALDVVQEGSNAGTDTVHSSVSQYLSANVENLLLTGTTTLFGVGNNLDNYLTGNSNANILNGNSGNDTLDGGGGTDQLIGGTGNDLYLINSITGGTAYALENANGGIDTIQSIFTQYLTPNVENLLLTGSSAIDGIGNNLANAITGNSADNTLNGNTGDDTLIGGLGNDVYVVDSTLDVVIEGVGGGVDTIRSTASYSMSANVENLNLVGNAAITGSGNSLDNIITGNSAANIINGGAGNDTLTGGGGSDAFKFATTLNAATNVDTITDFGASDQLQLHHLVFTQAGSVGTLSDNAFVSGAGLTTGQDADDRIIYNTTTGNLYYDADGSGAGSSILFAQLGTTTHPSLTAAVIQVV